MKQAPTILISPGTQRQGAEFADASISLSNRYAQALIEAGAVPVVLPCTGARPLIAELVRRADGVLLTGGDDVQAGLYARKLPAALRQTIGPTDADRDVMELLVIDEVFRQRKPLLAICRGQQILNVALGGTLVVDIPQQVPGCLRHNRPDEKFRAVHEVAVAAGSLLARATGRRTLAVNSTHHQAVGRVAKPLQISAQSADGVIEALELKTATGPALPFLLAVQFHPERLLGRGPEWLRLFRSFVRACAGQRT